MRLFSVNHIRVVSIKAFYDEKTCTKTKETANLLQYESQHFRCKVRISVASGETDRAWSIGLIQACDYMYLENRYGDIGSSFWEFHPIKCERHKMVNDSDGRQYPFYSLANSKHEIPRGRVTDHCVSLSYEDHFYPTVAWELPYCDNAQLTDIIRRQDFWVWLVAINRSSGVRRSGSSDVDITECDQISVLQTIRWRYNLHMSFTPSEPVGQRLDCVHDVQEHLPIILDMNHTSPPVSSLYPPHCNAAQSLIWYPSLSRHHSASASSYPRLLVPPKQIIVPWEEWVSDMLPDSVIKVPRPKDVKLIDTPNSNSALLQSMPNSTVSTNSSLFNLFTQRQNPFRIKTEA